MIAYKNSKLITISNSLIQKEERFIVFLSKLYCERTDTENESNRQQEKQLG